MSAFIVSDRHIDALVTYCLNKRLSFYNPNRRTRIDIDRHNAEEIGRILLDENVRSVAYRYAASGIDDDEKNAAAAYSFKFYTRPLSAVAIIKAVDCYDYQCCENDDWDRSIAWRICQEIKSNAIHDLPGYAAAPWGIDD